MTELPSQPMPSFKVKWSREVGRYVTDRQVESNYEVWCYTFDQMTQYAEKAREDLATENKKLRRMLERIIEADDKQTLTQLLIEQK